MRGNRRRLLVLIVAYNAEETLQPVLARIPPSLAEDYEVEVLVIDDSSEDATFERVNAVRRAGAFPLPLTVLCNPAKQGYGGNQKIGFHYAIERDFDFVALVHGDGKYAPERLPDLVAPVAAGDADAIVGSRMIVAGDARRGGMPLYKYVGNRILTWIENRLLGVRLTDFHSGYRIYRTSALRQVPFHLNTDGFGFDTETMIQLLLGGARIRELPIPTYYGSEIRSVNGIKYAKDVLMACARARAQELLLFYDRRFDCLPGNRHYLSRLEFDSTHTLALSEVPHGARVLDIGCGGGHLADALRQRGCHTTGVDAFPVVDGTFDDFRQANLNESPLPIDLSNVDCALMLDVIEHLASPERFADDFLAAAARNPEVKLIVTTGNVAFVVMRLMLASGQFNYGKRGILDLTHTRLFTFRGFRRLFEQSGFRVLDLRGVPVPFPLALGNGRMARALIAVNRALIRVSRTLFAYQIFAVVQPKPGLAHLLDRAERAAAQRVATTGAKD